MQLRCVSSIALDVGSADDPVFHVEPGEVFDVADDKFAKRLLEQADNFELAEPEHHTRKRTGGDAKKEG